MHRCKTGFGWCRRLLGDFSSLGSEDLLHPLLTTFWTLPFSGSLPELSDLGHTPSTAGTFWKKFRKNSGKTPKCSQSVSWNSPREYGWDAPNPIIKGIWRLPEHESRILSPPVRLGTPLFSEVVPERASQSCCHGIPSSTEGISEDCKPTLKTFSALIN